MIPALCQCLSVCRYTCMDAWEWRYIAAPPQISLALANKTPRHGKIKSHPFISVFTSSRHLQFLLIKKSVKIHWILMSSFFYKEELLFSLWFKAICSHCFLFEELFRILKRQKPLNLLSQSIFSWHLNLLERSLFRLWFVQTFINVKLEENVVIPN